MESREKLYYLLSEYIRENFNTEMFCDMFTFTYDIETDYNVLSNQEKSLFEELCKLTARFSSNEDDLLITNVYVSEEEIRKNAIRIYNQLTK